MKRVLITGGSGFIGTNLIESMLTDSEQHLLNLDLNPPKVTEHQKIWKQCDIMNPDAVCSAVSRFQPTHVIHLAGRTDMEGSSEEDYAANHVGTLNMVKAIRIVPSVERVIFTSSQFVVGPGPLPLGDTDFRPHTIYGHSKVRSERVIRESGLACVWTIIRPTNVWGKFHPRYPSEFWRVLKQGRYVHPGGEAVIRSYAYVGTIVTQIDAILASTPEVVNHEVFYVGDAPIDLLEWTNAFSLELVGTPVRVVPRTVLRSIALVGDAVIALGGRFPLFTSRYKSMTENYPTPMQKTFERLGTPQPALTTGVKATVDWLRSENAFWR